MMGRATFTSLADVEWVMRRVQELVQILPADNWQQDAISSVQDAINDLNCEQVRARLLAAVLMIDILQTPKAD